MSIDLRNTLERYRPEITVKVWEEAKPTVRIRSDVAGVIGDRPPDKFWDEPDRYYYGPSWLEDKSWAWLLFFFEVYEERRRMKHRRYFRWDTEPMVGAVVWIDDGPHHVRTLTGAEQRQWKPDTTPDPLDPEPDAAPHSLQESEAPRG